MAAPGVGQIAKLVAAFVDGDDNLLDKVLSDKLEHLGEEFLMTYLAGPFGSVNRIQQAINSGGMSEFQRLGEDWLKNAAPTPMPRSPFMTKVQKMFSQTGGHPAIRTGQWSHSNWAASRQDWLDNHWHHDWRSQPRDEKGRWIPGRLDYIAMTLQYKGVHKGRIKRHKAKLRRLARARGKRAARALFKELKKHAR